MKFFSILSINLNSRSLIIDLGFLDGEFIISLHFQSGHSIHCSRDQKEFGKIFLIHFEKIMYNNKYDNKYEANYESNYELSKFDR